MADSDLKPSPTLKSSTTATPSPTGAKPSPSPWRCWFGALLASGLSLLAYRLARAIALNFAERPIVSDNVAVHNISAAVRTLVVGIVALGTGVFGIAALGLLALGIQVTIQQLTGQKSTPPTTDG